MLLLLSVLIGIAALFGWLSARVLKLPNTIGTMLLTAITSIGLVLLAPAWPEPNRLAVGMVRQIDFERLILHGMLSLLLFTGAFLLDLRIALSLSIPSSYGEGWIVTSTYVLVVFSTLIQGGTMGIFLRRLQAANGVGCPCSPQPHRGEHGVPLPHPSR